MKTDPSRVHRVLLTVIYWVAAMSGLCSAADSRRLPGGLTSPERRGDLQSLKAAITDLMATFGPEYPRATEYLRRVAELEKAAGAGNPSGSEAFRELQQEALLESPLLDFERLILLKRKRGELGLPTNHQCNACLKHTGYGNEIAVLSPVRPDGRLSTLWRPPDDRYVGEIDLHFDADRLLFTMADGRSFEIYEMGVDGGGVRRVSQPQDDVDNFDACYLPDGRVVYVSTASLTAVPCWHGQQRACSLYLMDGDGGGVRQLCFDQDLDLHPSVMPNGQIVYSRWDYTGIMHIYLRPLMAMNPDGTAQRALYGSNSFFPNSLYFPRGIPAAPNKVIAVLSGYHGVNRMGELVLLDLTRGWHEADGIVQRLTHGKEPTAPIIRDNLVGHRWPKFLHPYPLSDKYFLAAAWPHGQASWGIYLVDVFDNMVPVLVDPECDLFEPLPLWKTPKPPVIPDRVDLKRHDAIVYLHNVYAGPGLAGVPRGAVKRLRIVGYHYGYPGMAGPDKIGHGGPWEVMRMLGTVPVYEDGSAKFRVPANTPISVQPLDAEGKALQLMRSWCTAMPGEVASCVGCHEQPKETPVTRYDLAATRPAVEIESWYGPPRGLDFERDVQPVLDQYCVGCHHGEPPWDAGSAADLRAERFAANYLGLPLSRLGADRLEPELRKRLPACEPPTKLHGSTRMLYTPAYEALIPFIHRVNIEDYVGMHVPGEYHADTSELIQMLQKGHHGVRLDDEAWDRLITWIDLNGPCHGTWGDVAEIPRRADRRRRELARMHGGPEEDPEAVPKLPRFSGQPIEPELVPIRQARTPQAAGWPFDATEAGRRQKAGGRWEMTLELGNGVPLKLVRIPAGQFVMGSNAGDADEYPPERVSIDRGFWMSTCEITNEQFHLFDASHFSGVFPKRSLDVNGPGVELGRPRQPATRVSWQQALAFCRWLSEATGKRFTLPTEAQWEYACRAGTESALCYGGVDEDFSPHANMADRTLDRLDTHTGGVVVLQEIPSDTRFDDRSVATAEVGSYRPNAWGLHDLHGNVAEWTLSTYRSYPYRADDGRQSPLPDGRKVVRGGSFYDRPKRCRSAFRLSYPSWQRVHNVGFRVVCPGAAARSDTRSDDGYTIGPGSKPPSPGRRGL
ncbi:MAG: SUMF1/EgtB/PvdO family nonheme iron enzyme [Pirellulales bacterium]|nr:SUMF1/EgtB/PvdO family nonheme iron enzyme [Pirellulales bacterium]